MTQPQFCECDKTHASYEAGFDTFFEGGYRVCGNTTSNLDTIATIKTSVETMQTKAGELVALKSELDTLAAQMAESKGILTGIHTKFDDAGCPSIARRFQ